MKDLAGKTAVVTGAGSGIGAGYCEAFAEAGMNVVVADINLEGAESTAEVVRGLGQKAIAVHTDVSSLDSMMALAEQAYETFGTVELVCFNAGVRDYLQFEETTPEVWRRMIDINIGGSVNGFHAFWNRLRAQPGEKHVVVTSSAAGLVQRANPTRAAYQTTKYTLVGLCETMVAEGIQYNIGVTCVCPGPSSGAMRKNSPGILGQSVTDSFVRETPGVAHTAPEHPMTPIEVGRWVRRFVERGQFWGLTHFEIGDLYEERSRAIMAAFAQAKSDYEADEKEKAET